VKLRIATFLFAVLTPQANAQPAAEFNQRLGRCDGQADRAKRAQCFERLAKDAVAELDRRLTAAAPPAAGQTSETSEQSRPKLSKYADFVAKAKANITVGFKDPSSVQWRNLFVSGTIMQALCGELNGKNSYGAYVGFRRFFATSEPLLQAIENPKQPFILEKMWESTCKEEIEKVE